MIVRANAKINIGLEVIDKRPDGFHNIQSLFYPLDFSDLLEFIHAETDKFTYSGISVNETDNLVLSAIRLLREATHVPPVHIHLHKQIPLGSGMGGGSSNATHTLIGLNQLFDLKLTDNQLLELAQQLGSDCPFFLTNKPSWVTGRGEVVKAIDFSLSGYFIKIIHPGISRSTAEAFSEVSAHPKPQTILPKHFTDILNLRNDFQSSAMIAIPELKVVNEHLLEEGAAYISLTGTGSALYGVFENRPQKSGQFYFEHIETLK